MRTISPLMVALLAYAFCASAHGAVTCVINKDSKKFESLAAKPGKDGKAALSPCDADAAKQTLESIQLAINTAGAKLVNPTVIVNAEKLPLPRAEAVKPVTPVNVTVSRVAETATEMQIPGTPSKLAAPAITHASPAAPAPALAPAQPLVKVEPVKSLRPDANTKMDWVLKASFNTLEEALEDFASRVDYEVVYEAREFNLNLKRDIPIARGANFWEALRILGETYRKSDGAFQILPTDFKQIVILPMGQNAATTQR